MTKPPWMFLPLYPLEDIWGVKALLYAPIVIFAVLSLVPFIDRDPSRRLGRRKAVLIAGLAALVFLVAMGFYAYFSPPAEHLMEG